MKIIRYQQQLQSSQGQEYTLKIKLWQVLRDKPHFTLKRKQTTMELNPSQLVTALKLEYPTFHFWTSCNAVLMADAACSCCYSTWFVIKIIYEGCLTNSYPYFHYLLVPIPHCIMLYWCIAAATPHPYWKQNFPSPSSQKAGLKTTHANTTRY